ncbi:valine--tRNA ligase, putative [Plasmodium vinckei vinckei]|uniref:valine--tRNA ligase n=1 Tax=Plasmodium vinckei vinckei TaxID=54757 RepID=A0A081IBK6_PLAVN|nr:valine--tRNA ligase, putative [Plasmodium vinckei vinckei]KEG01064.1 valyl-tRNA synthetase [Plasmodium vinckei vinckei]VEV55004.1 valine--tRNA ligase, putative [Plasmodium vinckei vinckei]
MKYTSLFVSFILYLFLSVPLSVLNKKILANKRKIIKEFVEKNNYDIIYQRHIPIKLKRKNLVDYQIKKNKNNIIKFDRKNKIIYNGNPFFINSTKAKNCFKKKNKSKSVYLLNVQGGKRIEPFLGSPNKYDNPTKVIHEIIMHDKNSFLCKYHLSVKYNFFKKHNALLNWEAIQYITKKYVVETSNYYVDHFIDIYKINQFENIYNNNIVSFIYLYKKYEKKKYQEKFNTLDYGNSFILVYPPPNLSGQLHAGHYHNFIYQDVILLFNKHILSKYALPIYGTDHGGLSAHEMFWKLFLKMKGVNYISNLEYITEISKWQNEIKDDILRRLQNINIVIDENEFYNTMDENMKHIVSKTFYILYKNKLILNKMYPVYYCDDLKTIIPRQDIEFYEKPKEENNKKCVVKLYIVSKDDINSDNPERANKISKENEINDQSGDIYIIPKTQNVIKYLEDPKKLTLNEENVIYLEIEDKNDIHNLSGVLFNSINKEQFQNKYAYISSCKKIIPMIYCKRSYISPNDDSVKESDKKKNVFAPVFSLESCSKDCENFQYFEDDETNTVKRYAYYKGHKCKFVLSEHWYIDYQKLSRMFYENNINTNFTVLPTKYKKYFFDGIINDDWILNRQIPYGHKIPIYKYECDENIEKKNINNNKFDNDNICDSNFEYYVYGNNVEEAYNNMKKSVIFKNKTIKIENLKQKDVLDSWLSSALYFIHCLDQSKIDIYKLLREKECLVDFICTGKDILHPWIVRSFVLLYYLVKNNYIKDILPNQFKNSVEKNDYQLAKVVKFHGLLKDNIGKKISKTDKNVKYYDKYLKNLNTDTVRLSFCFMQKEDTEDVIFSEHFIYKSEKFLRKLWSIANFIKINCSFNLYNKIKTKYKLNTNEKISNFLENLDFPKIGHIGIHISYCNLIDMVIKNLKYFDSVQAINIIHNFVMIYFSKFYINYYLYNSTNEYTKEVGNFLLLHIFKGVLKILYPFIPHITEVLYIQIYKKENNDISKLKQINEHPFQPLSSNYNFFENENFLLKKSVINSTNFDMFTRLFNYFSNLKKSKLPDKNSFHIYIKLNDKDSDFPLNHFYQEVLFFNKLFNMDISLYSNKIPLEKNNDKEIEKNQTLLYSSSDFDVILIPKL